MSDGPATIRMAHIRAADLCRRGTQKWFQAHGLSWDDFLTNGVPLQTIKDIGDPIADRVVSIAEGAQDGREE